MRGVGREKALGTGGEEEEEDSGLVEWKVMGLEAEQPIDKELKNWVSFRFVGYQSLCKLKSFVFFFFFFFFFFLF